MPTSAFVSILVASLLGSLHCAGMCGGLVALVTGTERGRLGLSHLGYHGARLVAYAALGMLAGFVGSTLDLAGTVVGLGRVSALAAGGALVLWGLYALARARNVRAGGSRLLSLSRRRSAPGPLARGSAHLMGRLTEYSAPARGVLLGFLSALLPCGWLHAFVLGAAATAHPLQGALVMVVFWSGTVPVLLGLGLGLGRLLGPLGRHLPTVTALGLVVAGLLTVLTRGNIAEDAFRNLRAVDVTGSEVSEPPMPDDCPLHGGAAREEPSP